MPLIDIVIVGAGQAGGEAAIALRDLGFQGRILMVGEEPHPPYRRPPLSKSFLAGKATRDALFLSPLAIYEELGIEFCGGRSVGAIDPSAHRVTMTDGEIVEYGKLIIATGGRARRIALPGADLRHINYLRSIDDVDAIRQKLHAGQRLVIVGGGYIGLEAAAIAVEAGVSVTLLEALPRVLARVTAPEISAFYQEVHAEAGVVIRTSAEVASFEGSDGEVRAVVLADGDRVPADFVIVGIGLIPNIELAAAAGLTIEDGIAVDEHSQTSDPDIFACGDCTSAYNASLGRRLRLESVANATGQAHAAAGALCGSPEPYNEVPWNWSDQYNLKLQIAGASQGYSQFIIRGSVLARSFLAFYLNKAGVVIAADAVNRSREFQIAKKLIQKKCCPDPAQLSDEEVALSSFFH
jgi:3-phenylpropionate/trans-cinnamate dioxygenase ferredoxin reductase subunit